MHPDAGSSLGRNARSMGEKGWRASEEVLRLSDQDPLPKHVLSPRLSNPPFMDVRELDLDRETRVRSFSSQFCSANLSSMTY